MVPGASRHSKSCWGRMGTQGCRQSKGAMNVRKHCVGRRMGEGRRNEDGRGEEGEEMEGRMRGQEIEGKEDEVERDRGKERWKSGVATTQVNCLSQCKGQG